MLIFERQYTLTTNASEVGVGAILQQEDENEEPMPWIDATVAVLNDVYSKRSH